MSYSTYDDFADEYSGYGSFDKSVILRRKEKLCNRLDSYLAKLYQMPLCVRRVWTLVASAKPIDAETFTDGTLTFTFKDTPSATYDVQIGADGPESLANLITAIETYSTRIYGTVAGSTLTLYTWVKGTLANEFEVAESSTVLTLTETVTPEYRFEILEGLDNQLTAAHVIFGEHETPVEGAPLGHAQHLWEDALSVLKALASGEMVLIDADGIQHDLSNPAFDVQVYAEAEDW